MSVREENKQQIIERVIGMQARLFASLEDESIKFTGEDEQFLKMELLKYFITCEPVAYEKIKSASKEILKNGQCGDY